MKVCATGSEEVTDFNDCQKAFEYVKPLYNLTNGRPILVGSWIHVPIYCTVQRRDLQSRGGGDDSAHFNQNKFPSSVQNKLHP